MKHQPYWCPKTVNRQSYWWPKPIMWDVNAFPFVHMNLLTTENIIRRNPHWISMQCSFVLSSLSFEDWLKVFCNPNRNPLRKETKYASDPQYSRGFLFLSFFVQWDSFDRLLKDVRANCFYASLLRTQIRMPSHAWARALSNKINKW